MNIDTYKKPSHKKPITTALLAGTMAILSQNVLAIGGCGSSHIPLQSGGGQGVVKEQQLSLSLLYNRGNYDNFKVGDSVVADPLNRSAVIEELGVYLDYGLSERVQLSLLVPYVKKTQEKAGNTLVADGIGDITLMGQYQITDPGKTDDASVFVGLGLKMPTGKIDEQGLPPAFQTGTGSKDLIPTVSYYRKIDKYMAFANLAYKVPMEKNSDGYQFGRELRLHVGASRSISVGETVVDVALAIDYLKATRDTDSDGILPAMMLDGDEVKNTGGTFLNLSPSVNIKLNPKMAVQVGASFPLKEDWNGDDSGMMKIGQVTPDNTVQIGFSYSIL